MEARDTIFLAALELPDATDRSAYLDRICGSDALLRGQVEDMLKDAAQADNFFHMADPFAELRPISEGPGTIIGRYKLLEKIGEGGMGVVYMAEQSEPIRRKVALKIIKLGMDTRQVVARFEAERQALALMDHPNIAKVLDAGATDTGRPYFVMELVQGLPITKFCDQAEVSTRQRLEVFLEVCSAIEHAHQKGIIHRDIKPSNVLVTLHGDKPVPKVIDFGIAKATQQRLTEKTFFTQFQEFVGTPAYTSPEQACLSGLDVDTRSDIYALGVLLYELLTGATPFDSKTLMKAGLEAMRKTIQEREPARPSAKLITLREDDLATTAKRRHANPPSLIALIRGDLDWIVMKCLEKDRNRRYETANALATDLHRHLNDEAVLARPPTSIYRLSKVAKRHRGPLAALLMIGLLLIAGLMTTSSLLVRARRAEKEQRAQLERAEKAEKSKTEELWRAYLATSRASRQSGAPGRRFASLEAIGHASAIRPSVELRNEAIAALALTDLGPPHFGQDTPWTGQRPAELDRAFDADVQRVALPAQDGSIYIHRVDDHKELAHIPAPAWYAPPHGPYVIFSPSGKFVGARFADGHIQCWELHPLRLALDVKLEGNAWFSLVFSPDERFVLAGQMSKDLFGYALGGAEAATNAGPDWAMKLSVVPWMLAFDPTRTRLLVLAEEHAQIFRWPGRELVQIVPNSGNCTWLDWHPDGRHVWGSDQEGSVHIWAAETTSHRKLIGPIEHVPHLAVHPRGDLAATFSWAGTTRLWNFTDETPMFATREGLAQTFSRDGARLGFRHSSRRYGYWPIAVSRTLRSLAAAPNGRTFGNLDFSPDGSNLIWTDNFGFCSLDLGAGGYHYYPNKSWTQARFNADGSALITGDNEGLKSQAIQWDRSTGEAILNWPGPGQKISNAQFPIYGHVSLSADRRQIVASEKVGTAPGSRVVLCRENLPAVALESPYASAVASASLSLNSEWLAIGNYRGATFVLNPTNGGMIHSWPQLNSAFVRFSPDGKWLIIGTGDEYSFWRTRSWEAGPRIPRGVTTPLGSPVAFSCDGRLLATCKGTSIVELRAAHLGEIGETIAALESPNSQVVYQMEFSPDGCLLAVIGSSTLQIWDLGELRRQLKAMNLDWDQPPLPATGVSVGDLPLRLRADVK